MIREFIWILNWERKNKEREIYVISALMKGEIFEEWGFFSIYMCVILGRNSLLLSFPYKSR